MTEFRVGSATDVGQVRAINQDSKLTATDTSLFAVADGMGGHQGGEVASAIAVETLGAIFTEGTTDSMVEAVREANRRIFARASDVVELRGMGTTLVAVALVNRDGEDEEVAWINVGDSRAYLLRDSELLQLSRDHSLVEDLRRSGQLSAEEAAVHPQRNILTRALGIDREVEVDWGAVMPFMGDRFLLCSDGLFNEVPVDTIRSVLDTEPDPDAASRELVRLANAGGGRDNITCVIVDVIDDNGRAERAAALRAESEARAAAAAAASEGDQQDQDYGADVPTQPQPVLLDADLGPQAAPLATTAAEAEASEGRGDAASAASGEGTEDDTPPAGLPLPPVTPGAPPEAGATDDDLNAEGEPITADGPPTTEGWPEPDTSASVEPVAATVARGGDGSPPEGGELDEAMARAGRKHRARLIGAVLVVAIVLLLGALVVAAWRSNRTYYVAATGPQDQLVIFRGKPGGFLFIDPAVSQRTEYTLDDYGPNARSAIAGNREFESVAEARDWLFDHARASATGDDTPDSPDTSSTTSSSTTTSTTTPTTSTTRPRPPTSATPGTSTG